MTSGHTTMIDARGKDLLDLFRTVMGVPSHLADEEVAHAVRGAGVDVRTYEDGLLTSEAYVKHLLGAHVPLGKGGGESPSSWRVLRRNIVTSYAVLRAHVQTVGDGDVRRSQRFSPGIRRVLDQLGVYYRHLIRALSDDKIGSTVFYMNDLDFLHHLRAWNVAWLDDILTRGGATLYERHLEGFADPFSFVEPLARDSSRVDLELDVSGFAVPRSVHALAVKLVLEDILAIAHAIGTDERPIAMSMRYNRLRDTIDVETPGDRTLFHEIRTNPQRVAELRASHDGWWLEGDRIAIPVRPFNHFSLWEMLEREIWENASALTPLMKKIVAGEELRGDDVAVWRENLRWLGEVASPEGMLATLQKRADKQGSREGYVLAYLVAKLRNTLQTLYSLDNFEERLERGVDMGSKLHTALVQAALDQGFPDGMPTLMRINGVLGPNAIRNLDISIGLEEDFTATRSKQYALNRFFNALFMVAALRAGVQDKVSLDVRYRGGVISLYNEDGRLFGMKGSRPYGIFAESAHVQPKLVTEILETARYISSDEGGMHISNSKRSAHIVVDPEETGIRIPYGKRSTLLPIPVVVRFSPAEMPFMQGMLTFYPALQSMYRGTQL